MVLHSALPVSGGARHGSQVRTLDAVTQRVSQCLILHHIFSLVHSALSSRLCATHRLSPTVCCFLLALLAAAAAVAATATAAMVVTPAPAPAPVASSLHPPCSTSPLQKQQKQQQPTLTLFDQQTAETLDHNDPLRAFRAHFSLPRGVYLCGQSLGACPNSAVSALNTQLQRWQTLGVAAHFDGDEGWATIHQRPAQLLMPLLGARFEHEVAVMNSLTVNLHAMLTAFYRARAARYKVLMEKHAFPSDVYAVRSHLHAAGVKQHDCILFVQPREGEHLIRDDDLLRLIDQHASRLALILLPGVQYFSGQLFPMQLIAQRARMHRIPFGVDLAHAVGNVPLSLHDWQVDFGVWCSYKYLNSGPGSIAGVFVHHRHADAPLPRHAGWWGHCEQTRFQMPQRFEAQRGAKGFQVSNPPVFAVAPLTASLQLFQRAGGMSELRRKSVLLTNFLALGISKLLAPHVQIISPMDSARRGCQISMRVTHARMDANQLNAALEKMNVRCDVRPPDVLRVAPVPLYNSFADVFAFVNTLRSVLSQSPL
eukprot:TRINITY_DN225_c0_g1_i2.p1 TRINITY_DN225_c0_g1~~TRINITY_DN225_c0_g1_i2.p1  ORF type:complete len:539 (+),score=126.07 TRINITY_DN225_c0_g1_i2:1929-3545(+)